MSEMDTLKKDFEGIQVPQELDLTVEKAIRKGRKEKIFRRVYKPVAIVACLVLLFIITAYSLPGLGLLQKSLQEGSHTTYVEPEGSGLSSSALAKERDIEEQIQESQIIVRGKVVDILDTAETQDLRVPICPGQMGPLHTNILIEVDEYLGAQLSFDHIVIRHVGGKVDGFCHLVAGQEHFTVGEDVLVFRLDRPDAMNQVPQGYSLEQYFLFQPGSKYVHLAGESYVPDFTYANPAYRLLHRIGISTVRNLAEK